MDIVKLCRKIEQDTVYLKDDYEDVVLRLVSIDGSVHYYIKRRGRPETEVDSTDRDIFECKMNGYEISKEEYDRFN